MKILHRFTLIMGVTAVIITISSCSIFASLASGSEDDASSVEVKIETKNKGDQLQSGCPATAPQAMSACSGDLTCEYGNECCCGSCSPSLVCHCSGSSWGCLSTDFCLGVHCSDDKTTDIKEEMLDIKDTTQEKCPATAPISGSESCSTGGQMCTYGEECCCGECFPSMECECQYDLGDWGCWYTEACNIPSCPDISIDYGNYADVIMPETSAPDVMPATCTSHQQCGIDELCMTAGGLSCGQCGANAPCFCSSGESKQLYECDSNNDCADYFPCGPYCADCPECPPCIKGWCIYPTDFYDYCLCDGCA